jgi:hypothetical protein
MAGVDEQLRELLRAKAVPPAPPPPGRYETARRRGQLRRQRRLLVAAVIGTGAAVGIGGPLLGGLAGLADRAPAHPAASQLSRVDMAVIDGRQATVRSVRGACDRPMTGVAWFAAGALHLAIWIADPRPGECPPVVSPYAVRLTLLEAYAGQPVVDEATGAPVRNVNGGPDFRLPTYRPPGYTLGLPDLTGPSLRLTGGRSGDIFLFEKPGASTRLPPPTGAVLARPAIGTSSGALVNLGADMLWLTWVDGGRGYELTGSSALGPDELVKIARSIR